jgi:hypothetical protein
MSLSRLEEDNENAFLTLRSDVEGRWEIPTARVDPSLPLPLSQLMRVSEVIPTAAVERPLSEVGVSGAKGSPHCPALL